MLKKRSKKALSHVDWAIALAIFLLYLAWFFVIVKPHLSPSENVDTLMDILKEGVKDNIYQTVNKVEVYIPNAVTEEYESIIIDFTRNYTKIANTADQYVQDMGKMFFLANLSDTKKYSIYNGFESVKRKEAPSIVATQDYANNNFFQADFDEGLLQDIIYDGKLRLWDFTVEIDGTAINDAFDFTHLGMVAKWQRQDAVNHTTYIFAKNPRVYNYIASTDQKNHTVTITFTTYNYTYYYTDTEAQLTYRIRPKCRLLDSKSLDLYDGNTGLLIMTDTKGIMLCTNETAATVQLEADTNYQIFAHEGSHLENYPITPRQGTEEELTLISRKKVLGLKNKDYQYQKTRFGFPIKRDFNITITSEALSATLGTKQSETENIYAKRMKGYMLDPDYKEKAVNITLTTW